MTDNIGLDALSTSTYFDLGEGRSAIYFGEVSFFILFEKLIHQEIL